MPSVLLDHKPDAPTREFGTLRFLGNNTVSVLRIGDAVHLRFGKSLFAFDVKLHPQYAAQLGRWLQEASE